MPQNPKWVVDRTGLAALDTTEDKAAIVLNERRDIEHFSVMEGDFTAKVAEDPAEAVYVPIDGVAASTAIWRRDLSVNSISPVAFGAVRCSVADFDPDDPDHLSSREAIQRCWTWAGKNGAKVIMDEEFNAGSQLFYDVDGLQIEWEQGAWTYQTKTSTYGGFILPRSGAFSPTSKPRKDVTFLNAHVDGQLYPGPKSYTVQSGSSTTSLILDGSAPNDNNAFVGKRAHITDGTVSLNGVNSVGNVASYNGSTKTVTLSGSGLGIAPTAGSTVRIGYNDIAIGFGSNNCIMDRFHIRNYPFVDHIQYVNGAKAIETEQGNFNFHITNGYIENCGHPFEVQGISWTGTTAKNSDWHPVYPADDDISAVQTGGSLSIRLPAGASNVDDAYTDFYAYIYATPATTEKWINRRRIVGYDGSTREVFFEAPLPSAINDTYGVKIGVPRRTSRSIISDVRIRNCGSVMTVRGTEAHNPDSFDNMVVISDIVAENCGHAPYRVVGGGQQKSGLIVLTGAANAKISNVQIRNDEWYPDLAPGYGGLSPYQVGYGKSGPVGAILWGTAVNTEIKNVSYHGDCDTMIAVNRGRAMGRDDTPTGALRYDIDGLYHYGKSNYVVTTGIETGASDAAPSSANLSGSWRNIKPGTVITGWFDGSSIGYDNVRIEIVDPATQRRHVGTMPSLSRINSFSDAQANVAEMNFHGLPLAAGQFRSVNLVIQDDTATSVLAPKVAGVFLISSDGAAVRDTVGYRASTSPLCEAGALFTVASSYLTVATGVLTGTTGADGKVNVSAHTDGRIYVENRVGTAQSITITFVA